LVAITVDIICATVVQNSLESDVSRMWKVMTKIVSVTTGALGTVMKGSDQKLKLLSGHKLVTELPKITLISTALLIHSARVNCFDRLLRSGCTRSLPRNNKWARINLR